MNTKIGILESLSFPKVFGFLHRAATMPLVMFNEPEPETILFIVSVEVAQAAIALQKQSKEENLARESNISLN